MGASGGSIVPSPAASGRAEIPWHGALSAKTRRLESHGTLAITPTGGPGATVRGAYGAFEADTCTSYVQQWPARGKLPYASGAYSAQG